MILSLLHDTEEDFNMTKETRAKVGETTFKAYKEITKIAADAHLTKEEKELFTSRLLILLSQELSTKIQDNYFNNN